ncbi:MAG: hypothetical protein WCB44_34375 [Stellaceae bacterium]
MAASFEPQGVLKGVKIVTLTRLGPTAVALGAFLAVAAPAKASLTLNALNFNALTLNSLSVNAITSNALTSNALTSNALAGNALTSNALVANAFTSNSLSSNAVVAAGSALGQLNGVAVEAVILPDRPRR